MTSNNRSKRRQKQRDATNTSAMVAHIFLVPMSTVNLKTDKIDQHCIQDSVLWREQLTIASLSTTLIAEIA